MSISIRVPTTIPFSRWSRSWAVALKSLKERIVTFLDIASLWAKSAEHKYMYFHMINLSFSLAPISSCWWGWDLRLAEEDDERLAISSTIFPAHSAVTQTNIREETFSSGRRCRLDKEKVFNQAREKIWRCGCHSRREFTKNWDRHFFRQLFNGDNNFLFHYRW